MPVLKEEGENISIGTTAMVVLIAIILSFIISFSLLSILNNSNTGTSTDTGTIIVQITPENNQGTIQVNLREEENANISSNL